MSDPDDQKRIEQAQYRAKLIQAELNAIQSSRAYQISKKLGIMKAQLTKDPVGLSKKAARIMLTDPKKFRHLFRTASRGAFITQSVTEQTAKYQEWILLNEPDELELEAQRVESENFKYRPLISILTPVFNPPVDVLEELIESMLEQSYANFELCLGNFGDDPDVKALIAKYAKIDPRVKDWPFTENRGIGYNSNLILKQVSGEYTALLDHDDTLSKNALYENVKLLNAKKYDFIYSDKDKIDEAGNRFDPLFKPKLSPEMLLNINYLTHLNVMRTSLVKAVGGWDSETDGAQDWDLFLKIIAKSDKVAHIPKVLYHWRVIASSTAFSIETKPYALAGQRKAVDNYMKIAGIPAESFHRKTELFLRWAPTAIDTKPLVFVYFSNITNLLRVSRYVRKTAADAEFVVLLNAELAHYKPAIVSRTGYKVVSYQPTGLARAVCDSLRKTKHATERAVLFLYDTMRVPNDTWYVDLVGWLSIPSVGASSGRLLDRHDLIIDDGGVVTPDYHYAPLFKGFPKFYQSYIGNAEWVRDLSIISASFCSTKLSRLQEYAGTKFLQADGSMDSYFLWLSSQGQHIVMTPHATATLYEGRELDPPRELVQAREILGNQTDYTDPYGNPNVSQHDPMRLFDDEPLIGLESDRVEYAPVDAYQHDATILANTFDINQAELAQNKAVTDNSAPIKPRTAAWFVPSFDAIYAGLINIFSFADYMVTGEHLKVTIFVLKGDSDVSNERQLVLAKFPGLAAATFTAIRPDVPQTGAGYDIGIATQWASAYPLAKHSGIKRKCYFIQDNEANFYPQGSISSLVTMTYSFGFVGIANTPGLLQKYQENYGGRGVVTKSRVSLSSYFPRPDKYYTPKKPYKVFFYARPNMPRNAFELGIAALKRLKQQLGPKVEIITAGAAWDPAAYGVEGLFNNLGLIAYEAVPKLYRSVDAGLMFMFSGHPGVTASELMASGCPVVVNQYDDATWHDLYQHEKTCLVSLPTASEVARNLERCLTDQKLRRTIIDGGLAKIQDYYSGYEASLAAAYQAVVTGSYDNQNH